MEWIKMTVAGKNAVCFSEAGSRYLLIQPGDENDLADLQKQTEEMERLSGGIPCTFCAFQVDNWFEDLSPWEAPPVFGKTGFGSGANATLDFLIAELIPALQERFGLGNEIPVFIGGYSLAGLFALYAAYSTRRFAGCAAVSPSVWFPNWNEYASSHEMGAPLVYLSLGDKEEKTKNRQMATVGMRIKEQKARLETEHGVVSCLEWNEGNHFSVPWLRMAKGFAWLLRNAEMNKSYDSENLGAR